jgi:hypothetical protein
MKEILENFPFPSFNQNDDYVVKNRLFNYIGRISHILLIAFALFIHEKPTDVNKYFFIVFITPFILIVLVRVFNGNVQALLRLYFWPTSYIITIIYGWNYFNPINILEYLLFVVYAICMIRVSFLIALLLDLLFVIEIGLWDFSSKDDSNNSKKSNNK